MAKVVECKCGHAAIIRTSGTGNNPGRLFYACPNKGPRSGFIAWVDEEKYNAEALKIAGLVKANKMIEIENKKLISCLIFSWVFFIGILVYKL